jgi:hypothetical protein
MIGRLILALALIAAFSAAACAQPDFTTSRGEVTPAAPYAGDVVRHAFTVTNTGAPASYASVSSSLRRGFLISTEGDCAPAKFDDSGDLAWHSGRFDAGAMLRCTLTVLTRRGAAGTLANVATEIRVPPSGYFRIEAAAELRNPPDPNAVRVGPVLVTRAGMVVTALLAVFLLGVPIVIALSRSQVGEPLADGTIQRPTGIYVGGWAAVVIALGFLLFFVAAAYEDWRAYSDYRETNCTVFGSELNAFENRSRSRSQEQSYSPLFAVRYPVDGVETFSTGYTTSSALNFNTRADTGSVFDRFAIGTTHPCWYDPQDPTTVVLARGPGGAYVFALLPIPVLVLGLSALTGLRRSKRDAATGSRVTRA